MATGIKNISRVRVEAQERLDLPDFNALQALIDESVQQQIGNAFGCGSGLLSPMQFTLTDDGVSYWIQPGAFSYYWSKRDQTTIDGTYRAWKGGVGVYDPAAEGQTVKWDYTAARAAAVTPTFVYVRPKAVDTATDARRKFSGGVPTSVSLKTRTSVVHELKFATSAPDVPENDGWACVMVVTNWAAVPNSPLVSVWDSYNAFVVGEGSNPFYDASKPTSVAPLLSWLNNGTDGSPGTEDFNGGASTQRDLGLIQLLFQLRDRLYRVADKNGTLAWHQDGPRDLVQLDTDLALAGTTLNGYHARIMALEDKGSYSWYVQSAGLTYTATNFVSGGADSGYYGSPPVFTRTAAGRVNVAYTLPTGAVITGIHVTPAHRDSNQPMAANAVASLSPTAGQAYYLQFTDYAGVFMDSSFFLTLHWVVP